jgi:polar amino acid transport system substrate-binding protein
VRSRSILVGFALIVVMTTSVAHAQAASDAAASANPPATPAQLRVAIASVAPFVLPQPATPEGFSIDIWSEIARRMHADFEWHRVTAQPELLAAVQHGDADVAIAAISMTPGRERSIDFSMPYFDSGLQIMVRAQNSNGLASLFQAIPWLAIGQLVAIAVAIVFVLANLVWLTERKRDATFQKPYWQSIGEGIWITMLIIATGEYGERDAPGIVRRLLVPAMWLIGVVLIAQLTATVTSSQTVAQLQSNIRGPDDLPGKKIASVPGSIAGQYLTERGLPFVNVTSANDGYTMLMRGDVQAIVYDAPTLQYWAGRLGNGSLLVVGPVFRPMKYGIAVANGSALRKPINEALLAMYEDGTYEQIYGKWFSHGK